MSVVSYLFCSVKRRHGLPRCAVNLQRTRDSLRVSGGQSRCRHGVYRRQLCVQRRPAQGLCFSCNGGADGGVGARHVVQAVKQGLEVKHGAPDQQRQSAPGMNLMDELTCIRHELGRAVGLQRVADIDQVVRHTGQLCRRGFGGANVHAPVHQGGVNADDLHADLRRYGKGGGCLARGGGSGQGNAGQRLSALRVHHIFVPASMPPGRSARTRKTHRTPAGKSCRPGACPANPPSRKRPAS